jgi:adenosine deaminase CECR1
MKEVILLGPEQANEKDSHEIWKFFQHKFTKVGELGKFVPFFKDLMKTALQRCIDQNVFIVEFRHISGMLFNEDKQVLPLFEELRIIRGVIDELQATTPHFEFKLVLTGLKIIGKQHIDAMLRDIKDGVNSNDKRIAELIAGFDMVNEEDYTPEIGSFAQDILQTKQEVKIIKSEDPCCKETMPTFFHCGETHARDCKNLQDAILLGTKRIGHGFQL